MACTLSQRSERDCSSPAAQSLRQLGQWGVSRIVSRGAHTPRATTLCSTASDLTLQFLYEHTTDILTMGTASWLTTHMQSLCTPPAARFFGQLCCGTQDAKTVTSLRVRLS